MTSESTRSDGRATDQLRPITFELNYTKWAEGSVLAKFGDTHVLCNVTVDERVPRWLHQSDNKHGWVTAEYAMLPRSTNDRLQREQRWPKGRTMEISRLIGRSLRMAVDLRRLGMRQLIVDCDVIQADGGTRTAAISGSWVAAHLALQSLIAEGKVSKHVFRHQIAAISVGIVDGVPLLDLAYDEDVRADTDLNLVMTADGRVIEVQGTAEKDPFTWPELNELLKLGRKGIQELTALQADVLQLDTAGESAPV
jgi:ribonuclease PH